MTMRIILVLLAAALFRIIGVVGDRWPPSSPDEIDAPPLPLPPVAAANVKVVPLPCSMMIFIHCRRRAT